MIDNRTKKLKTSERYSRVHDYQIPVTQRDQIPVTQLIGDMQAASEIKIRHLPQ